jgi:hypothetical protein
MDEATRRSIVKRRAWAKLKADPVRHEMFKAYQREYQKGRREARRSYERNRKLEVRLWINQVKSGPCADCRQCFEPVCMDFDHRDPREKIAPVATLVSEGKTRARV